MRRRYQHECPATRDLAGGCKPGDTGGRKIAAIHRST